MALVAKPPGNMATFPLATGNEGVCPSARRSALGQFSFAVSLFIPRGFFSIRIYTFEKVSSRLRDLSVSPACTLTPVQTCFSEHHRERLMRAVVALKASLAVSVSAVSSRSRPLCVATAARQETEDKRRRRVSCRHTLPVADQTPSDVSCCCQHESALAFC